MFGKGAFNRFKTLLGTYLTRGLRSFCLRRRLQEPRYSGALWMALVSPKWVCPGWSLLLRREGGWWQQPPLGSTRSTPRLSDPEFSYSPSVVRPGRPRFGSGPKRSTYRPFRGGAWGQCIRDFDLSKPCEGESPVGRNPDNQTGENV